ncbi:hypothetical protein BDN72DRAFT_831420 [Pluteus cervinus]|uniref:Uncharacterized protein n=1 Tax=Pluteus cervinus TaxID=181527 RepID=A0ACD3BG37_9AGAR|nr:hypothetical protein BDN72DRAFT_831420 [Pluteus cervinus]
MPSYYPTQSSHSRSRSHHQPVVYTTPSSHGGGVYRDAYPDNNVQYVQAPMSGGVVYTTPSSSSRKKRHGHGHGHGHGHSHSRSRSRSHHGGGTQVIYANSQPMVTASSSGSRHGHHHHHHSHKPSLGQRIRHFFGLAPQAKYHSRNSSWGFMGRSKRPRYYDTRTGKEVDERGRPVIRY